jgi:pyrroline-5-carboxylate reductase
VIDPVEDALARHRSNGLSVSPHFIHPVDPIDLVIWAVKPQSFHEACVGIAPHTRNALHLSVAAGLTTDTLSGWLDTDRIVRAMPNTPALIGKGQTGLFARSAATELDRQRIEHVMAATGQTLWVSQEALLDAVTALSGSGPAYVFYFMEAMMAAGQKMGLPPDQTRQLVLGTFEGATALALASSESPGVLREKVTSKGGTTFAALEQMRLHHLGDHFVNALMAARNRAEEMGRELGERR